MKTINEQEEKLYDGYVGSKIAHEFALHQARLFETNMSYPKQSVLCRKRTLSAFPRLKSASLEEVLEDFDL